MVHNCICYFTLNDFAATKQMTFSDWNLNARDKDKSQRKLNWSLMEEKGNVKFYCFYLHIILIIYLMLLQLNQLQ